MFNKIPKNSIIRIFLYLQNFCTSNFCVPWIFVHLEFLRVHIFARVSIFLRACPYFACVFIFFCVHAHIYTCVSIFLRACPYLYVRVHIFARVSIFFRMYTSFHNYDQHESFGSVLCLSFNYHSSDTLVKSHLGTGSESTLLIMTQLEIDTSLTHDQLSKYKKAIQLFWTKE